MKKQEKMVFNQKKTNPVNSRSTDDLYVIIVRQGNLYFVMEFRGKEGQTWVRKGRILTEKWKL